MTPVWLSTFESVGIIASLKTCYEGKEFWVYQYLLCISLFIHSYAIWNNIASWCMELYNAVYADVYNMTCDVQNAGDDLCFKYSCGCLTYSKIGRYLCWLINKAWHDQLRRLLCMLFHLTISFNNRGWKPMPAMAATFNYSCIRLAELNYCRFCLSGDRLASPKLGQRIV